VVDAAGANQEGFQIINDVRKAGQDRLAEAESKGVPLGGAKLGYVYTSGNWVHGTTKPGQFVNDLDPVSTEAAPELVKWRVECEKAALAASDTLDVAVVRPGEVYGFSSWLFSSYFDVLQASAQKNPQADVTLPADSERLVGLVHVDDVGTGLHTVVDKLPLLCGTGVWPIFDLQSSVESLGMILIHAARVLGVQGKINFEDTKGDALAEAISTGVLTSSGRAKALLGWEPKHIGMLSEIEIYVGAWRAAKSA